MLPESTEAASALAHIGEPQAVTETTAEAAPFATDEHMAYMRSISPVYGGETDEKTVEQVLVEEMDEDEKHVSPSSVSGPSRTTDIEPAAPPMGVMVTNPQEPQLAIDPESQHSNNRIPEQESWVSGGGFLLKRSPFYVPSLAAETPVAPKVAPSQPVISLAREADTATPPMDQPFQQKLNSALRTTETFSESKADEVAVAEEKGLTRADDPVEHLLEHLPEAHADMNNPSAARTDSPGPVLEEFDGDGRLDTEVAGESSEDAVRTVDSGPSQDSTDPTAQSPVTVPEDEPPAQQQMAPGEQIDLVTLTGVTGLTSMIAVAPRPVEEPARIVVSHDTFEAVDVASHLHEVNPGLPVAVSSGETGAPILLAARAVTDESGPEVLTISANSSSSLPPTAGEPQAAGMTRLANDSPTDLALTADILIATCSIDAAPQPTGATVLGAAVMSEVARDTDGPLADVLHSPRTRPDPSMADLLEHHPASSALADNGGPLSATSLSCDSTHTPGVLATAADATLIKDEPSMGPSDAPEDVLPTFHDVPTLPAEVPMLCDDPLPSGLPAPAFPEATSVCAASLGSDPGVTASAIPSPCAPAFVLELSSAMETEPVEPVDSRSTSNYERIDAVAMSCSDDVDVAAAIPDDSDVPEFYDPVLDLPPSSPPPSSSPPHIFSSPPRDLFGSPPTSSPPLSSPSLHETKSLLDELDDRMADEGLNEPDAVEASPKRDARPLVDALGVAEEEEERPSKRTKTEPCLPSSDPPVPKRLTQASIAKQRKKLAAPFRSPVIKGPLVQGGLHAVYTTGRAFTPPPLPRKAPTEERALDASIRPDPTLADKNRTVKVAKQFKSPLTVSAAGDPSVPAGSLFSAASATPTIQALQGRLQTLKQAIRIKKAGNGDEEAELERLVDKWRMVGREVAWAVWGYVKDLDPGTSGAVDQRGGWFADRDDLSSTMTGQKRGLRSQVGLR
ncbi:hypothetical protein BV20DRAFT_966833 [Pilatotrama ljubarskyi]|nr:hypothetical protein BV20DRAFT_966833 [Pilatotrama ljubarskyi]